MSWDIRTKYLRLVRQLPGAFEASLIVDHEGGMTLSNSLSGSPFPADWPGQTDSWYGATRIEGSGLEWLFPGPPSPLSPGLLDGPLQLFANYGFERPAGPLFTTGESYAGWNVFALAAVLSSGCDLIDRYAQIITGEDEGGGRTVSTAAQSLAPLSSENEEILWQNAFEWVWVPANLLRGHKSVQSATKCG